MKLDYNLFIFQSMVQVITLVESYRRKGCCNCEISTLSDTASVMNKLGYTNKRGKELTEVSLWKIIQRVKDKFKNYRELVDVDFDAMKKYSILEGASNTNKEISSNELELDENDMKLFKSFETAKQNIKSSTELQESFDEISDIKLYDYLKKRVLKKKKIKRNVLSKY